MKTRSLSVIRNHGVLLAAALMLVASTSIAVAQDAIRSSKDAKIYACVTKKYGTLNYTTKSRACPTGQRKISWNASGKRGARGAAGAQGDAGAQGPAGLNGATGAQGLQGVAGPQGPQGLQGLQGVAGPQGLQGLQGVAGPPGQDGRDGYNGVDGVNGANGADGEDGRDGYNGVDGVNGANGADGKDGKDGAQGPPGPPGPQGIVDVAAIEGVTNTILGGSSTYVFAGPTTTLTTTASQTIIGSGVIPLGATTNVPMTVNVSLCTRPSSSPGDDPSPFGSFGGIQLRIPEGTQAVVPVSWSTSPGAGTWTVGICVRNAMSDALDHNGYSSGWLMVVND